MSRRNAGEAVIDLARALLDSVSSSIKLSGETNLHTCEAAFTQVDAGCAVDVAATPRRGTNAASFVIGAAAAQGIQARAALAVDNTDISAKTHLLMEMRVSAALGVDDIRFGFDNTAAAAGTQRYSYLPAITLINTWHTVCMPMADGALMTQAYLNALTSVSTLILYLQDAAWVGTILIDNIRVVTIANAGAQAIVIPQTHVVGNDGLDVVDVFDLPYDCLRVDLDQMPVNAELCPYVYDTDGVTLIEQGRLPLRVADYLTAEAIRARRIAIRRTADITGTDADGLPNRIFLGVSR